MCIDNTFWKRASCETLITPTSFNDKNMKTLGKNKQKNNTC